MTTFHDMATMQTVAHMLIGLRLNDVRKRHNRALLHNISSVAPTPESAAFSEAGDYLPPRRLWLRPHAKHRHGFSRDQIARQSIWRTIKKTGKQGRLQEMQWGQRLLGLTEEVRALIAHPPERPFSPPQIALIPKGGDSFRVMAASATLLGRLVSGLLARYLEQIVEPCLGDDCYSFRVDGTTYHDAVLALEAYRGRFRPSQPLYVAECDLRGFYDGLVHSVAIEAVHSAARSRDVALDAAAEQLLLSLLASYSYPGFAYPRALDLVSQRHRGGKVRWLTKAEQKKVYGDIPLDQIGIPQGNPVSPVLSNAVLLQADQRMREILGDEGFYARYCDDIILLHPRKQTCTAALNAYIELMRELNLPVHPPQAVGAYDASVYSLKSKKAYRWGDPKKHAKAIPWIQFVGYQMNRQGDLRIRKESVNRQKKAVTEVYARARHTIKKSSQKKVALKASASTIKASLAGRVIWSGTGQKSARKPAPLGEPCWIDAYPLVQDNPHSRAQMRELDRHRDAEMRSFKRWLKKQGVVEEEQESEQKTGAQSSFYYGAPYSYSAALQKKERKVGRVGYGE